MQLNPRYCSIIIAFKCKYLNVDWLNIVSAWVFLLQGPEGLPGRAGFPVRSFFNTTIDWGCMCTLFAVRKQRCDNFFSFCFCCHGGETGKVKNSHVWVASISLYVISTGSSYSNPRSYEKKPNQQAVGFKDAILSLFSQGPRGPKGDKGPAGVHGPSGLKVSIPKWWKCWTVESALE